MDFQEQERYNRAKKRVDNIKGFYIHLIVYLIINTFIIVKIYSERIQDNEEFWEWQSFFTAVAWGVGLAIHGLNAFGPDLFFGKNWEERKIRKLMEEDKDEFTNYTRYE